MKSSDVARARGEKVGKKGCWCVAKAKRGLLEQGT